MADTALERSLGQEADIFAGNLIDRRHGGPITIGYGRYAPNQSLSETLAVDDVMVILEAELSSRSAKAPSPRAPVRSYMSKVAIVTIRSGEKGAVTAYVTYPHWQGKLS